MSKTSEAQVGTGSADSLEFGNSFKESPKLAKLSGRQLPGIHSKAVLSTLVVCVDDLSMY